MLLLLQTYQMNDSVNIWQAVRAWINGLELGGYRVSGPWSNGLMLVTALLFIFLLELLLTLGIQVWERRTLARMQSRWGPQLHGNITPQTFRRVLTPILILLAIPAVLYGIEYWSSQELDQTRTSFLFAAIGVLGLAAMIVRGLALNKAGKQASKDDPVFIGFGVVLVTMIGAYLVMFGAGPDKQLNINLDALTGINSFVPLLASLCSILAFLIYIVYTLGWAWRQGLIDAVKIFFKEDVVPLNADRFLFLFAPVMVYLPALLSWIVLPFGVMVVAGHYTYMVVQDLNVGILLIIADFALFLVAVIMSGYGSNNKYALIGAMREAAMLLTYEIPMLMALLCVALFAGSLNLTTIVEAQSTTWAVLPLLPAFIIYLVVALAECNRPPFDLAEASNELMGGYLVEYSGIRFALFYVAEYANVFTVSALMAVCFFGGWKGPMFLGLDGLWLSSIFWMLLKTYAIMFFFIWARATMPRIRIDQIMFFSWKFLLPISVLVLCVTSLGVAYRHPWFMANRIPYMTIDPITHQPLTSYQTLTTLEALKSLTLNEKVFFWCYNFGLAAIAIFILALAWRILFGKKTLPRERRAVTWQPQQEAELKLNSGGGGQ
ncbi:NADH-quinone oxidoreductase subunit H [bacterium]|nr:NADH-quinone oxidoreductase subunit H [bacterium]